MKMESSRHGDHVCFFIIGKIIMTGAHSVESLFFFPERIGFSAYNISQNHVFPV
ncbi:hypothetical protein Bateq7PJ16_2742 [Bacillus subtilis]|nr:hypothetical protein Bateq7PJ16_2742 [Bacillus subtilis]